MRAKLSSSKKPAEKVLQDIRQVTGKQYSTEDRMRILPLVRPQHEGISILRDLRS
jgi:hypothetical protein